MSRHQNAGQNHNINIANRSFENVAKFKCLGTTAIDGNLIHEEIKSRLNSDNTCYHSIQNYLSCRLSKNVKIKMCKTVIFLVVLYGFETWFLTLREEHRLRVFENRELRTFGLNRDEIIGGWRKLNSEELHNLSSPYVSMMKSRRMRWAGHVVRMGEG
jgi:hypothetical protein